MKPTCKHPETLDEGWSVQIYSGSRRLVCSLDPSHGWTFLAGCITGFLLTVAFVNMGNSSTTTPVSHPSAEEVVPLPID